MRPFAKVDPRRLEVRQAVEPLPARVACRGAPIQQQAVRGAVEASRLREARVARAEDPARARQVEHVDQGRAHRGRVARLAPRALSRGALTRRDSDPPRECREQPVVRRPAVGRQVEGRARRLALHPLHKLRPVACIVVSIVVSIESIRVAASRLTSRRLALAAPLALDGGGRGAVGCARVNDTAHVQPHLVE
eukprot:scaffold75100_cov69-Phaeocystis_antarctica.AAC.1